MLDDVSHCFVPLIGSTLQTGATDTMVLARLHDIKTVSFLTHNNILPCFEH